MSNKDKFIGYISDIFIKDGSVICRVEDKNNPQKSHSPCQLGVSSFSSVSVPPVDSKVLVERVEGEKIITNILSSPGISGIEAQKSKEGSSNGAASMSFVFTRDEGSTEEFVTIQYSSEGYNVTCDVEGDIVLDAGGSIKVREDGVEKKVATVDHDHELTYDGGGNNSSTLTTTTDSTTENTNN